jgi:hypothetical protein
MTNFTKNMMIAAAALTIAAGVAGAQTIKAEVPFGFRAAGTVLPAGAYRVSATNSTGIPVFQLTNEDTGRSVLAMPYTHIDQKGNATPVSLTFECAGTNCALVQVAPGSGPSYQFMAPKMGKDGDSHLAVIRAVLVR